MVVTGALRVIISLNKIINLASKNLGNLSTTRTVRGSDYSPAIELSEQKGKLVTATGDTEKYSEKQAKSS